MSPRILAAVLIVSPWMIETGCTAKSKPLPIVAVAAEHLAEEWKTDRNATFEKYKEKQVEVTGAVYVADNDNPLKAPVIHLNEKDADKIEWIPVKCLMREKEGKRIKLLCKGQIITIRGILTDPDPRALGPLLDECELREIGPSPALTTSPEEIAKDYISDKKRRKRSMVAKVSS